MANLYIVTQLDQGFIQDFGLGGGGGGESIDASMKRGNVRGGGWGHPAPCPPQNFFKDLASLAKFDKFL